MFSEDQDQNAGVAIALAVALIVAGSAAWYTVRGGSAPKPMAANVASAVAVAPQNGQLALGQVQLTQAAGVLTLTGIVPDEKTHQRLLKPARVLWGEDKVVDHITVSADAAPLWWLARPVDILARLRQLADFDLKLGDGVIALNGTAGSEPLKQAILSGLPGWFVKDASVKANLTVNAQAGVAALAPSNALLEETIEFATGSAQIPGTAQARLVVVADLLKDDGRNILITGHTDNTGDATANKTLSLARANSVVVFLVAHGVTAGNLHAQGAGQDQPIADNGSEEGRAHNRRIEFSVQ
ncbi:OmpA family protein [Silvimonas soli]|uniref:OmpA family protein n=1 Tax=Silvimonas soli TaxID=2980100 RepID=UPI0024B3AF46|nr:OmpA family protein [Silvimonas soli]